MTDTLSSTQTWAQLANGASLGGSGIFGLSGAHKHKGGSAHQASTTAGSVSDPSLSFNKLFANDLSQNALSETDPSAQYAAAQQAAAPDDSVSAADTTSSSNETQGLSGPLAPGLLSFLMGMTNQAAASSTQTPGQAAVNATTPAADDDLAIQPPTVVGNETGSATTPDTFKEILSELAELSEPAPTNQPTTPSSDNTTTAATTDTPSTADGTPAVAEQAQTDPAGSPAALQATALLEMQKALTAYFSGNLTNANATAATTSIAI